MFLKRILHGHKHFISLLLGKEFISTYNDNNNNTNFIIQGFYKVSLQFKKFLQKNEKYAKLFKN